MNSRRRRAVERGDEGSPLRYAAVVPLVRTRAFREAFDYEIPRELDGRLRPGSLVAVPLGPQTVIGVVVEVRCTTTHEGRILPVHDLLDVPAIPEDLLDLARHVERYYLTAFTAALALVCPPIGALRVLRHYELTPEGQAALQAGEEGLDQVAGLRLPAGPATRLAQKYRRKGWVRIAYRVHIAGAQPASRPLARGTVTPTRLGPRQRAALELVEKTGGSDELTVRAATGLSLPGLRRLLDSGALVAAAAGGHAVSSGEPRSDEGARPGGRAGESASRSRGADGCAETNALHPATADACMSTAAVAADMPFDTGPDLLPEQRAAVHAVVYEARPGDEVLLHGVTGSGKTEVYLRAAQAALEGGRSVLFLVPEIGLTGQTVTRVRQRFAGTRVAVLHSGLTSRERLLAYDAVSRGEVRVVVGARSAVFAPLQRLGLIVVDEEHDTSYKQESEPAYDARTVARWRAAQTGAVVVLGSATPSVESYARVRLHADLRLRVDGSSPPAPEIVDMRDHHGVFSAPLASALAATIDAGDKAILFLNRRGFASYLVCDHCGFTWMCPRCDVTLTLFGGRGLRCRTCGHAEAAPAVCPGCGSADLMRHGFGTERVEREVRSLLPGVELLRLDSDVAASYARLRAVLDRFAAPGPKVLVGTQMIAKGHHFPDVTLVGVVNADLTLHFPDFRAEERTFAMIVQVAGRSGRGSRLGRVVVQTLSPEARPIARATRGEDEVFYDEELTRRRELGYPPAGTLVALELSGGSEEKVGLAGRFTAERLATRLSHGETVLGPGPLWRERGRHACRVVVKTTDTGKTLDTLRVWLDANRDRFAVRGVRMVPDVDPQWL